MLSFFSLSTPVIERLSDALHPVLPRGEITAGMYANGFSGCESFASLLLAAPLMALLLTVSTLLWQRARDRSVLLTEENRRPPRAASSEGNKPVRQNTWPALASEPREEARGLYKLLSVSEPPPPTYDPTAQAEGSSGLRKPSSPPHPHRRFLCCLHSGFIWVLF